MSEIDNLKPFLFFDITCFTTGAGTNAVKKDEISYYTDFLDRRYRFKLLSESDLINNDEERILLYNRERRNHESLFGDLRILMSGMVDNHKFFFSKTKNQSISPLIECIKDSKEYIIDYDNNIVMPKADYIDLFEIDYDEIEVKDDQEIYNMIKLYKSMPDDTTITQFVELYDSTYDNPLIQKKYHSK